MIDLTEELKAMAAPGMQLPPLRVDPAAIRTVMINEVVPECPENDFYGSAPAPLYLSTALTLFRQAGFPASSIHDVTDAGIYITNAVKTPKRETTVPQAMIEESLPVLERELSLFPNLRAVMLMGDVAKKAFNMIARGRTGKNAIPPGSTYKLRRTPFHAMGLRIFPSYIMTGRNILIEKSKMTMAAEDIRAMLEFIHGQEQPVASSGKGQ